MLKRCWAANKIMAGATMMTWTNILKKATMMSLIGALGCALLFATEASAGSECSTESSSTPPTTSPTSYASLDKASCLSSMPMELNSGANISHVPGNRSGKMHKGMDVGIGGCNAASGYNNIMAPADGRISDVVWNCAGGRGSGAGNYIVMEHNLNRNNVNYSEKKSCTHYYSVFFHLSSRADGATDGAPFKKGAVIAKVGGTNCVSNGKKSKSLTFYNDTCKQPTGAGYAIHMHYEVRLCKWQGKVLNPLCPTNQALCNGAAGVDYSASSTFTNSNPNDLTMANVQLEDCSKYKTVNTQAEALAKCEKILPAGWSISTDPKVKAKVDEYNACVTKAKLPNITQSVANNKQYEDCMSRNEAKKMAAGDFTGRYGAVSGASTVKENFKEYESNYKCNISENYNSVTGCVFCPLFKIIYNSASVIATKCHKTFASSLQTLLAIGLAISLAMIVMKYVSDMTVKDTGMMLNEIFRKIFVVVLIMLLLQLGVGEFFNIFVTPVLNTGFKLASMTMGTFECKTNWGIDGSGLPADMGNNMLCAIYAIQERLQRLMALGSNSLCIAFYVKSFYHYPIFPHFGYLLTGLFLWLIAIVFMVCYPFLLIDSVLQFCVAMSLFPAALAATAFKLTSKYLNIFKVINIFMNAMFVFIFLTIVLFILLEGIDKVAKEMIEAAYKESESAQFFSLEKLGWYCQNFITLIFFLFLGKAVLEDIPSFAEDFGKSITLGQGGGKTNMGIGRNLGGLAAGAATGVATQVGKPVLKAGAQGIASAAKATGKIATTAVKTGRYNYLVKRTMNKMNAAEAAGGAAGAFVTGRTWYGKKVSRRVIQNPDGSMALESKRTGIFNRNNAYTSVQNDMMSIKTRKGKNGLTKESYSIKDAFAKSLINKDGTRNDFAVNALMNSAGLTEEQKNKVILNQMLKQRMPGSGGANLEGEFKDEKITTTTDKNGNKVFEVRRTGKNGEIKVFRMTRGKTRDLIEYEKIQSSGNGTAKSTKWASDGAIQKKETCIYETNDDGTLKTNVEATAMINGAKESNVSVDANGILKDKNGTVQGKVMANGNIVDKDGKVVGTAQVPDLVFDNQGQALGKMNAKGEVVDNNGNVKAVVTADGTIVDLKSQQAMGIVSDEQRAAVFNALKVKAGLRKVEFSNAKAFKGQQIFDDDGFREDGMQGLELMMDDSDLALYKAQMKKYGDVLQHHRFGR